MLFKRLSQVQTSIGGGAVLIAFFSIVSKFVGLYRDRLLAASFGASRITDIYFASFKLPDFIFNILVLGALTSAFVPVFQRTWKRDSIEGIVLANSILNILLVVVGVVAVVLYVLTPVVTPLYVPGFSAEEVATTIAMTRLVLISLLFFTASNVLSGVLNSWRKFFTFALSSVVYNVGIIVGIVFFYPAMGIFGLAWGVVLGSALHFGIQLVEAVRNGWWYQARVVVTEQVRKIFTLMIPRALGLAGNQIALLITALLASSLAEGSLAVFAYAQNLQSFPVGIFGISLAVAAFPSFSDALAEKNTGKFKELFAQQCIRILYFLIPISLFLLLLRAHVVRVILGAGSFDWTATRLTAQALGFFAISLGAQGLIPLLTRSFYALEDTKTPVTLSFIDIILTIFLSYVLVGPFGVLGLALASSVGSICLMLALFVVLHRRFGDLNDTQLLRSSSRIFLISVLSAALTYLTLQFTDGLLATRTFTGVLIHGMLAGSVGVGAYLILSAVLGIEEVTIVRRYLNSFLRPIRYVFRKR